MKLINFIIIGILSITFVACGGDDDKDKESKNKKEKEERGWKKGDKDNYIKDCNSDSSDEVLAEACDCALSVAENNFDSYKKMQDYLEFELAYDADEDEIEAYNEKLYVIGRATEKCFIKLFNEELDSQYGDLDDGNYFWDESDVEAAEEAMVVSEWFPYEAEEAISNCVGDGLSYEACECIMEVFSENIDYDWFEEIMNNPDIVTEDENEYLEEINVLVDEACSYLFE